MAFIATCDLTSHGLSLFVPQTPMYYLQFLESSPGIQYTLVLQAFATPIHSSVHSSEIISIIQASLT